MKSQRDKHSTGTSLSAFVTVSVLALPFAVLISWFIWNYGSLDYMFEVQHLATPRLHGLPSENTPGQKSPSGITLYDPSTFPFPVDNMTPFDYSKRHTRQVHFTTKETTWTYIDISPDSKTLLFDVLGDIYTVPIEGGRAVPLVHGVPLEKQATYSPDGTKIAFVSDANGCDAIWVLDLTRRNLSWPVTTYQYEIMRHPVWLNNNEIIAIYAQSGLGKFMVARYSIHPPFKSKIYDYLGQVELYEEPAVVPDTNILYYSSGPRNYEVTPTRDFFAIYKVDLETGASFRVDDGSRPVLSRDGKYLAYVKRIGFETCLMLKRTDSFESTILYKFLNHDSQTSYMRMFGSYPNFKFYPNTPSAVPTHLIFWADGKILKLNIKNPSDVRIIPVTVAVNMRIAPAVANQRVHVDSFDGTLADSMKYINVKSVRGIQISRGRAGTRMIRFKSLGKTFENNLDNLQAEPTPSKFDELSFENTQFGSSFLSLSSLPGVKSSTHEIPFHVQSVTLSVTQDIMFVSVPPGGRIDHKVILPQKEFVNNEETPARVFALNLFSLQKDETVGQIYAPMASIIKLSADGTLCAFIEFSEIYVVKVSDIPEVGGYKVVQARSRTPMKVQQVIYRVSRHGGLEPTFFEKSLFYIQGSKLYEVELEKLFETTPSVKFQESVPIKMHDLSFQYAVSTYGGYRVFYDATIVTMDQKNATIKNGAIVIQGNRIVYVGPKDDFPYETIASNPRYLEEITINCHGGIIIPGLIDSHAHSILSEEDWTYEIQLAYGVTTIFDPSSDNQLIFERAERSKAGLLKAPRIFSTGQVLVGFPYPYFHQPIFDDQDALDAVRRQKAFGAIAVKSYMQQCRSQTNRILDAARKEGLSVVPEGGMAYYFNLGYFIDGHTTQEHSFPISHLYGDVIGLLGRNNTAYVPTLTVAYGDLFGKTYWLSESNLYDEEKFMRFFPESYKSVFNFYRRQKADATRDYSFINVSASAHKGTKAGLKVLAGAHGEIPGIGLIWELFMLVQGGFTPLEAIQAATIHPAQTHGMFHDIGSLEKGKLADFVIFPPGADVISDIKQMKNAKYVVKDGVVYDADTLETVELN